MVNYRNTILITSIIVNRNFLKKMKPGGEGFLRPLGSRYRDQ